MTTTDTGRKKTVKPPTRRKRGKVRLAEPPVYPPNTRLYPITHFGKFGWKFPDPPDQPSSSTPSTSEKKPQAQLYPIHKWKFDSAKYTNQKEQDQAKNEDADVSNNEAQSAIPDPPSPSSKTVNVLKRVKPLKRTEHGEIPRM
ncbi:hypothetical protein MD484_g7607, partial [Candolleomyces efflorescens]